VTKEREEEEEEEGRSISRGYITGEAKTGSCCSMSVRLGVAVSSNVNAFPAILSSSPILKKRK